MKDVIHLLPDHVANQIAAGEVVQRPASVIKELLENSIDAQASNIQVFIKEAGKILIRIVDNGVGMSLTDARLSFERHATSKIKTAEDLFSLQTKGFRGRHWLPLQPLPMWSLRLAGRRMRLVPASGLKVVKLFHRRLVLQLQVQPLV